MDAQTLRAIATEMRAQHSPPLPSMLIRDYHVAVSLYAFIEGIEAVANNLERQG